MFKIFPLDMIRKGTEDIKINHEPMNIKRQYTK